MAQEEGPSEEKGSLGPEKHHHPGHPWLLGQSRILTDTLGGWLLRRWRRNRSRRRGVGEGTSQASGSKGIGGLRNLGQGELQAPTVQ